MATFRIEETPGPDGGLNGRQVSIVVEFDDVTTLPEPIWYLLGNAINERWEDELRRLGLDAEFIEEVRAELGKKPR